MITVRIFYSYSNQYFKKGLTSLLEDILHNENETHFNVKVVDDISLADIAFLHKESGDNPALCNMKRSAKKFENDVQLIVTIDYEKNATDCNLLPVEMLPYKGCLSSTRILITSHVKQLLEKKKNNLIAKANSCTTCLPAELSKTEKEIIALITYGSTTQDIATFYRTCVKRVSFHKRSIIKKLKLRNITEFNHHILNLRKQLDIKHH